MYRGYPRIYAICRQIVATEKNIDQDKIINLLEAYQSETPLKSSELHTLPEMLSLCLLEHIIKISNEIQNLIKIKERATLFVSENEKKLMEGHDIMSLLSRDKKEHDSLDNVFLSHVLYLMKRLSVGDEQIERCLVNCPIATEGMTNSKEIFFAESHFETLLESIIRSLIVSFTKVRNFNTEKLFDTLSPVEKTLSQDPAGLYSKMDIEARSSYRYAVERLSRRFRIPELKVAETTLSITKSHSNDNSIYCPNHVGAYLSGKGLSILISTLKNKSLDKKRITISSIKKRLYFASMAVFSLLFLGLTALAANRAGYYFNDIGLSIFLIFAVFPIIGIAIEITNHLYTRFVPTKILPALDFVRDIPDSFRTFVVMPVIVSNNQQVEAYVNQLEKHYLSNFQRNLFFAVLGDFEDAPERVMPKDVEILKAADDAVAELNRKYPSSTPRFYSFFRYRERNESEDCWMGWERKRGKLEEFNALLFGEEVATTFIQQGDKNFVNTIRYVITLDSDTRLMRDSAAKFIGIMAHPLNQPLIDPKTKVVKEGYVIIQSEIHNHMFSPTGTIFHRIFADQQGLDPYSAIVSDVYQDAFEESTFFGKGIYDVEAMYLLMNNTFPKNTVLSHDLLESCYSRCGFSSGAKLMDVYPSSVKGYFKREHRWIRGDWQLVPWLFKKSRMNGVSKWKIFENLRRSLGPICNMGLILANAFFMGDTFYLWIPIIFLVDFIHLGSLLMRTYLQKIEYPLSRVIARKFVKRFLNILAQAVFQFLLIPYRGWIAADAITRTIWRLGWSHKRLLQWQTAEAESKSEKTTLQAYVLSMGIVLIPAGALGLAGLLNKEANSWAPLMLVLAFSWFISPVISYFLSCSHKSGALSRLSDKDKNMLRQISRRTWQYFIDFATPERNWLIPDNYQVSPGDKVSDKTSPTNIGLQMLSIISGGDFGYIGKLSIIDYLENLVYTLSILQKWHGHLFNWYNIKTLQILSPQYVSTVDSGNFTAYLITVKNALIESQNQKAVSMKAIEGVIDSLILSGVDITIPREYAKVEDFIVELEKIVGTLGNKELEPWENETWIRALIATCQSHIRDSALLGDLDVSFEGQNSLKELSSQDSPAAKEAIIRLDGLINSIDNMIKETDFGRLFDDERCLFHIGFHGDSKTLDSNHYDLIASESMLTSFLSIAKGDVSKKHWNRLGRPLTMISGFATFVSWSGTMFEYLMPHLVLKEHKNSVFNESSKAAVTEQIRYGKKLKIPWGISESQYYRFDIDSNYQYRAFGVPRLRLQFSVKYSKVVSPYSTFLALPIKIRAAMENIWLLHDLEGIGEYGFFEALDYNSPQPESLKEYSIVRSFMAHHQGMILVSINNLINENTMQNRFHSEPMIGATEPLLEETRGTGVVSVAEKGYTIEFKQSEVPLEEPENRYVNVTCPEYPKANWLSNGQYSLYVNSDGDGFSRCKGIMLNRWRGDTFKNSGNYIYIRDIDSNKYWTTSYRPTKIEPDKYQAMLSDHNIEFKRLDSNITTHTTITLSPSHNVEIRKVKITNHDTLERRIETTSYMEVVLDKFLSELYHPAFNKLFIESKFIKDHGMLVCKRRNGKINGHQPYLVHMAKTDSEMLRDLEFETDRLSFVGRNNTLETPKAMGEDLLLSNKSGFSTDPIVSLRSTFSIPPGEAITIYYITGICSSLDEALSLSRQFNDEYLVEDISEQFRLNSELEKKYLNLTSREISVFQDLITPIFYPSSLYRGNEKEISRNKKDQSGLWRFGISGDNPILLLRVNSVREISNVTEVLKAYEYFRINLINVDLVILSEAEGGYLQELESAIMEITSVLKVYGNDDEKNTLFILRSSHMEQDEIDLLVTVSRIVFTQETGIYFRQVQEESLGESCVVEGPGGLLNWENLDEKKLPYSYTKNLRYQKSNSLKFFNGFGGFSKDGKEYVILPDKDKKTPMPWINVIANDKLGFLVSETGAGYTWSINSRENKISTWSNDPVMDPKSEAIYIRDKSTGQVYEPTSMGNCANSSCTVRHGFGYSVFSNQTSNVNQEMLVMVPLEEPVRLWKLTLTNNEKKELNLEATLFVELVLGVDPELNAPYVVTSYQEEIAALLAKNVYNGGFGEQGTFIFSSETVVSYTGDRREFFGVNGNVNRPKGLGKNLSRKIGASLDPCGVIQVDVSLQPGEKKTIVFGLGQSDDEEVIKNICVKYRDKAQVDYELDKVRDYWDKTTGQIKVTSKDPAMDILINGWLVYQTITCRIRARTAFYQSGGAYGFRDQLQDVLSLLYTTPEMARAQIIIAASRQFEEGDVQHWWHPPKGLGVRTRITDDLLWLPYVTALYVKNTGDYGVLEEMVPFLVSPPLKPDEKERMEIPDVSEKVSRVYDHCMLSIRHAKFGERGLPLMGGGDWNDGMNMVGIDGKGESVWLGWFLYSVINEMQAICEYMEDKDSFKELQEKAETLRENIEKNGWDGKWYRRGFFDNGDKLGSKESDECRIDSIAQSWSVISKGGSQERILEALSSVDQFLIEVDVGVSRLLTPPFNEGKNDPGYIKNYYPGMRENGGQYTHAAVWFAMAKAMIKKRDEAYELFRMLNPINITSDEINARRYEKEPYVMIADISMAESKEGKGGWSWYTGSAGWMYQGLINWFLGIRKEGDKLLIDPSTPISFGDYKVDYRFGSSLYEINIKGSQQIEDHKILITLDGKNLAGDSFDLIDDNILHNVEVTFS